MPNDYNLLDENWIPVLYRDGTYTRVGILKALEDAGRIRQIAASNPMDRLAVLRFLLSLLYWCKGNPPAELDANCEDPLPRDWFAGLEEDRHCFKLLGCGQRFYQNAAYKGLRPEHTTNYLIHEVPTGNNCWHFRHSTDRSNGICCACCAMGLIRLPIFATSGGKGMHPETGKSPGINAKPPLYVVHTGSSLAATLRHSWRMAYETMGTPEWETPNVALPRQGEVPFLTGLTWIPRSIWLSDPEEPESVCISCGQSCRLIRTCVFDGKGTSKAENRSWRDPHVVYQTSGKGIVSPIPTADALGNSDAAAGQWTTHLAAALMSHGCTHEGTVWIVSFATVQNDKYLEAFECYLPRLCSPEQIQQALEAVDRWKRDRPKLLRRVNTAREPGSGRKHGEILPLVDSIRPEAEARAAAVVTSLLDKDEHAWQKAADEYPPMMGVIARSLSPGTTINALESRHHISEARPDIQIEITPAKQPRAKKGGKK